MASVNLNDFIPDGCIQISQANSFLEASSKAALLLEQAGVVKAGYEAEVIQIIKENGPYMVLAPQVAIVHGRPSEGTDKTAAAVFISESELISGSEKNDPVRVIFAISATSNEEHIEMLKTLALFLTNSGVVEKMQQCSTVSEVRDIFSQYLQ
ncbi:MAG: PTS sugar transporter subunit IIA [Microbacteriaceae bacterium]|nr:PTS sugar transporter subunit IIA [Microbacteriaceae bacterium]MDR9443891.1 PTS sugar transporter subunit IIA [Microbacteriaceae bacterium]